MRFEQAAELEERGGVRGGLAGKVDPDKAADGLAVVEGVFDAFVGEAETLLPDVHAQHPGKTDGRASRSAVAGLEGGYGVLQRSPWNNGFDVGEETITPRQLFLRRVFQFGKARLHRLSSPRYRLNRIVPETQDDGRQRDGINQCFLNNGVDILDERE